MRTTITLDEDVSRAVERLRRKGLGVSEAVNALARRGLAVRNLESTFVQSTASLGRPRIPIDDIGGALETLEGDAYR